jgi:hypothetical protein
MGSTIIIVLLIAVLICTCNFVQNKCYDFLSTHLVTLNLGRKHVFSTVVISVL